LTFAAEHLIYDHNCDLTTETQIFDDRENESMKYATKKAAKKASKKAAKKAPAKKKAAKKAPAKKK
jgi:hypothetical protein